LPKGKERDNVKHLVNNYIASFPDVIYHSKEQEESFVISTLSSRDKAHTVFTVSARDRNIQPRPAFSVSFS